MGKVVGEEKPIVIPWGTADSALGAFQEGGLVVGPRFFDLDTQGRFHVADAYKGRVAIYDDRGTYLEAVPLAAVSPRMTAFGRASDGTYVTANDQSLGRWTAQGNLVGERSLGLVIPQWYGLTSTQASVVLEGAGGTVTLEFSQDFSSRSQFSLRTSRGTAAAVKDDQSRVWGVRWSDQAAVYHWTAAVGASASLAATDPGGRSVWTLETGVSVTGWKVDDRGQLLAVGHFPSTASAGGKLLLFRGPDLNPWVARWTDQGMEFRAETWPVAGPNDLVYKKIAMPSGSTLATVQGLGGTVVVREPGYWIVRVPSDAVPWALEWSVPAQQDFVQHLARITFTADKRKAVTGLVNDLWEIADDHAVARVFDGQWDELVRLGYTVTSLETKKP